MITIENQTKWQEKREKRKRSVKIVLSLGAALGCACLWLLSCFASSIAVTTETSMQDSVIERGQWELTEGTEIVQEFIAKYSYLETVKVLVANLDENSRDCKLVVTLQDAKGKELCRQEVPVRYIKAGNFYEVPVQQSLQKNELYRLGFHAEHVGEYIPRLLYVNRDEDVWEQTDLYVMGELQEGGLVLGYTYRDRNMKGFLDPTASPAAFFRVKTAGLLAGVLFLLALLFLWMDRVREQVRRTCRLSGTLAGQAAFLLFWPALFLTAAFWGRGAAGASVWGFGACAVILAACLGGCVFFLHRMYRLRGETLAGGIRKDISSRIVSLVRHKWFLAALLCVLLPRLLQFTKTVRFSAGEIYASLNRGCAGFTFTWDSFWQGMCIAGPWTMADGVFLGIGEFLSPGGVTGVFLVRLLLAGAAFYCLYQLFRRHLLQLSEKQAAFSALLLFSLPLFLGTFSYLSLDDMVLFFFLFLLYAQCRKRFLEMAFWILMLSLSKETGAVLAAAYLLCRLLLILVRQKGGVKARLKAVCLDRGNWAAALAGTAGLFHLYLTGGFESWMEGSAGFGWNPAYAATVFKQVFILNFNWIGLIILLIGLAVSVAGRKKRRRDGRNGEFLEENILLALACLLIFQIFYQNGGYALDQLVLAAGFCAVCVVVFWRTAGQTPKSVRTVLAGGAFLVLFWVQAFADVDAVSGALFPVRDMGGRIDKLVSGYDTRYYGEGYVNNAQYTWMDRLLDCMLAQVGYDRDMTVILAGRQENEVQIDGRAGHFTLSWNPEKGRREYATSSGKGQIEIRTRNIDRLISRLPWEEEQAARRVESESLKRRGVVFFFQGYEEDEEEQVEGLKRFYYVGERQVITSPFGSLAYYELCKKESYMGFTLSMFLPDADPLPRLEPMPAEESYAYRYARVGSFLEEREDIREGDALRVELYAYLDGELLPEELLQGGSYEFTVGDGTILSGIEQAAIGHTVGDEYTYRYEVPEQESGLGRLAGETIEFRVSILANEGRRYAEDLSVEIQEEMQEEYREVQRAYETERRVREALAALPETEQAREEVDRELEKFEGSFRIYLLRNGLSEETYLEEYLHCSQEEYRQAKETLARAALAVREQEKTER